MIDRPLNDVTAQDIESLLRAEVPEGRTLDYKEQLDIWRRLQHWMSCMRAKIFGRFC